jgi:hypothetical protein
MASDAELQNVMRNLNRELTNIKVRSARGLVLAAATIRRDTETTPPLTPVDLGNLRASWFVTVTKVKSVDLPQVTNEAGKMVKEGSFRGYQNARMAEDHRSTIAEAKAFVNSIKQNKIVLMMGYSAHYALYVHEGPHGLTNVNFQRPGAGLKWFEAAVGRNARKIVNIIRDNARIK